jgi:hypothetical protein
MPSNIATEDLKEYRPIPRGARRKLMRIRGWCNFWRVFHIICGGSSAAISVFVALNANAKSPFLAQETVVILAGTSAVLAFLLTSSQADKLVSRYERASSELEQAVSLYQTNPEFTIARLGEAEARAILMCNSDPSEARGTSKTNAL